MTSYTLVKMSHPGWTMKSDHIQHIRWMLEQHVCKQCKWTKADYETHIKDHPEDKDDEFVSENQNPYTFTDFFPENYEDLPENEKIYLLLSTACGYEFWMNEEENGNETTTS